MKKILTIAGIVLAGAVLFLAGFYLRPQYDKKQFSGTTSTAKKFVTNVTSGDTDAAYVLTSKSLQAQQSKEEFTDLLSGLKADKPEFSPGQAIKNGEGILYYQRVLNMPEAPSGSTNANFYITLEKEGDTWKVATVSVQ